MRGILLFAAIFLLGGSGGAHGAIVVRSADDGALALAPNGSPRVAYAAGRELFLAQPRTDGSWGRVRVAPLPAGTARVSGLEVDPRGRAYVLVQDEEGRWLLLADRVGTRWRVRQVAARLPAEAVLGAAGLALDRVGKPAVGYAFRLPDRKTFLRLVSGGTFRTIPITREGFPESGVVPSAAPVLMPDGKLRVLETYSARGGGAILWRHNGADWRGLFLSSSVGGTSPVGPAFAEASGAAFAAAWTLAGPAPGELQARLALRPDRPQSDVLHRRARVEAVAVTADDVELAATEPVGELAAGLLISRRGSIELDGRVLGVAAAADGRRHLLLANPDGLWWYATPVLQTLAVSLNAAPAADGTVELSGRVAGAISGTVEVLREPPDGPRELVAVGTIAPDGSFAVADAPPTRPAYYRAVYRDPLSGIPYASLLRRSV